MRVTGRIVAVVMMLIAIISCGGSEHSVDMHDSDARGWSGVEEFVYDNSDTLSPHTISIVLRYCNQEVSDSLALRIMAVSPDSLVVEEPFTLYIPRLGELRPAEHSFTYRSNVIFSKMGKYRFRLTPESEYRGIGSVGVMIGKESNESE